MDDRPLPPPHGHQLWRFSADEIGLIADRQFFLTKAEIMRKIRGSLEELFRGLKEDLNGLELAAPPGFDPDKFQFVKGEHLNHYPYQYLDFPKHFDGDTKFTFRSLFWWGHHFVFAWMFEGAGLLQYKQNLINRYHQVAGRDVHLSLAPSLWDWRRGEGYTMPLTHDRKSQVSAVLSGRPFFKIALFVAPDDPAVKEGRIAEVGRTAFRTVLPVITR
jgi:hypothetical protein